MTTVSTGKQPLWPALRQSLAALLAAVSLGALPAGAQPTPPHPPTVGTRPRIQEAPLPPPVELPPPPHPPAVGTRPPDVPSRPVTADEAAAIALRNQPTVSAARAGVAAAAGRTQQARSGLGPTLGVTGGYTHVETLATEGGGAASGGGGTTGGGGVVTTGGGGGVTVAGYNASATIRQLLYDFNHTRDLVRQARAQQRAAGENLTRVQSDLVLQVKQAFYTYVEGQRLVGVNEANLRNQQARLELAQARLHAGLGAPLDVVRAQTAVQEAILNLNVARNNASVARVNLALLMGIDPRTPIKAAETGEPAVATEDVGALVQQALGRRPEVLQAQDTLQSARYGVGAVKTSNAPSLGANVSVSTRGATFPPGNDFRSVGASIQWTPFDSGLRAGRVREARANVEAAEAQLRGAQLSVTSDVSQAYLNLRTAEQRVTTADAEESVRLAEGRYRAGVGTFIDVIDAQPALLTARTNRVNAQSAVDQARVALARATGAPVPAAR